MRSRLRLGLRGRIALLIGLATAPAVGLLVYTAHEQRLLAHAEAQLNARRIVHMAASSQETLLLAAPAVLSALAHVPQVSEGDAATCTRFLGAARGEYPFLLNLGRVRPDGRVSASALPLRRSVSLADRSWFRDTVRTRRPSVGEYQVGRITGRPSLNFGFPVLDRGGHLKWVLFAALDLAAVEHVAREAELPEGATLTLTDRRGTVLVRYPEGAQWVGRPTPEFAVTRRGAAHPDGIARGRGPDGAPRLYGIASVGGMGSGALLTVSIPEEPALARVDRLLLRNLIIVCAVGLLALITAFVSLDLLMLRPLRLLIAATGRLAAGDLSIRTGLTGTHWELGQLARAFDRMAEALQQRTREREATAERKALLLEIYEQASHLPDQEFYSYALEQAVRLTDSAVGFLHRLSADEQSIELTTWSLAALQNCTAAPSTHYAVELAGNWADSARLKHPVVYNDYLSSPNRKGLPEGHATLRRLLSVPVLEGGRVRYVLGVGNKATDYDDNDVFQLQLVANEVQRLVRQRQDAEALRESENKFRFLFDTMAQGVVLQDTEGRIVEANEAASAILELPMDQLVGRTTADPGWKLIREDGSPLGARDMPSNVALRTGRPVSGVTIGVRLPGGGSLRWIVASSVPRFEPGADRPYLTMTTFTDVTERKRTEDELGRLTTLLEQAQALTGVGGWEFDVLRNELYWTSQVYATHELSPAEYTPAVETALDFYVPEARPVIEAALREAIEQGTGFDLELDLVTARSRRITVRVICRAVVENGRTVKVIGAGVDITARRQAEQALRDSEERFRTVFESANDAIFLLDGETIIDCNSRAVEMFGLQGKADVIGHSPAEFAPARQADGRDTRAAVRAYHDAAREGRPQLVGAWRLQQADGTPLDVEVSLNALQLKGRTYVQAVVRDVSRRVRAEQALLQSERKFRSIVEASPTAMHFYTLEGGTRLVFAGSNPAADRALGLQHAALVGKGLEEAFPNLTATFVPDLYRRVATGESGPQTFEIPYGDERFSGFYLVTVFSVGEGMIVADFLDITERRQAEEALLRAHDELELHVQQRTVELSRSNAELQQFAYAASHDLQEPLRKIMAFGDRLRLNAGPSLDERNRDYLTRMLNAAQRMSGLIDALLAYSRVTTKGQPFSPVDLSQVARETLSDLEVAIEEAGATVTVGDLPTIEADPAQMRQLLQNLIGNAVKFRRPEVPVEVRVEAELVPGPIGEAEAVSPWVRLRVSDNGIGFEQRFADRIFEVFERLHGREEYAGSGIGLAICRRIVQRHGGTISAEGHPGEGSVFTVELPTRRAGGAGGGGGGGALAVSGLWCIAPEHCRKTDSATRALKAVHCRKTDSATRALKAVHCRKTDSATLRPSFFHEPPWQEWDEMLSAAHHPITLLIADDDLEDCMMLREALEQSHLANDLRFVHDGEELMAYLRREGAYAAPASAPRPGLILLDLNMPRKDGREALGEIKADPKLHAIPVVVLTTSRAEEDIYRSYELGVNSYISKPVTFASFMDMVATLGKYWLQIVELPPAEEEAGGESAGAAAGASAGGGDGCGA